MHIRRASLPDVPIIISMLAQDPLGITRENRSPEDSDSYIKTFKLIAADSNQHLVVLESNEKEVIGTCQLTFIPYLTYRGGIRAQIEAVRIHSDFRNRGAGKFLIQWAIDFSQQKGAHMVQLTTDKRRPDALEFYKKMGFEATHEGMKLHF